jgi:P27 family predicted phage terminase small subunit
MVPAMGKRGPRPQPTVLKAIRGTIRTKDRRRGPDAMAPAGRLEQPAHFDAGKRKRWAEILALAPASILRPIDTAVLEDFIDNEDLARRLLALVGDDLIVAGEKVQVRNPALLAYAKAIEAKRAAMRELGFTPAARVGLPIDDAARDPEEDRWAWLKAPRSTDPRPMAERQEAQRRLEIAWRRKQAEAKAQAEIVELRPAGPVAAAEPPEPGRIIPEGEAHASEEPAPAETPPSTCAQQDRAAGTMEAVQCRLQSSAE